MKIDIFMSIEEKTSNGVTNIILVNPRIKSIGTKGFILSAPLDNEKNNLSWEARFEKVSECKKVMKFISLFAIETKDKYDDTVEKLKSGGLKRIEQFIVDNRLYAELKVTSECVDGKNVLVRSLGFAITNGDIVSTKFTDRQLSLFVNLTPLGYKELDSETPLKPINDIGNIRLSDSKINNDLISLLEHCEKQAVDDYNNDEYSELSILKDLRTAYGKVMDDLNYSGGLLNNNNTRELTIKSVMGMYNNVLEYNKISKDLKNLNDNKRLVASSMLTLIIDSNRHAEIAKELLELIVQQNEIQKPLVMIFNKVCRILDTYSIIPELLDERIKYLEEKLGA